MALHASGVLGVGGRDIACVSLADGTTHSLLSLDAIPGATGFNDLTTDDAGRIYVGSLAFRVFGGEAPKPDIFTSSISTARCAPCPTA